MFDGSAVEKRSVNLGGRRRDNASASELARRARVERAMAAADWAGVLKELEPADIRSLVAASYADAAAHRRL